MMNATGVAKLIGVNAVPTVRGNRKIPINVNAPRINSAVPRPLENNESSEVSTDQAAPKYENKRPIPAKNPIMACSPSFCIHFRLQRDQGLL